MKHLTAAFLLLLTSCGNSQQQAGEFEPDKLITTHFGSAPVGEPPALVRTPSADETDKFEHLPLGTVKTTVDTVLYPSEDLALVFFRTSVSNEPDEDGTYLTWLSSDWLSLAAYTKGTGGWTLNKFEKWFCKQGIFDLGFGEELMRPVLLKTGGSGRAVKIVSSDGEPEYHRTTHHLFGIPDFQEVLTVVTEIYEVERVGVEIVDGAEAENYRYDFIRSDKDWYDVTVEGTGTFIFDPVGKTYVAARRK